MYKISINDGTWKITDGDGLFIYGERICYNQLTKRIRIYDFSGTAHSASVPVKNISNINDYISYIESENDENCI